MTHTAKYETRIRTTFGELVVHFDTVEEFQEHLKSVDVEKIVNTVREKLGRILTSEPRQPKPGLEDVYRFTSEGYVELLKVPKEKAATIGLVLFAFDPQPASFNQVSRSSGIKDPSVYLSHKAYSKHFTRTEEGYLLSQEGKVWIQSDVLRKLTLKSKE